MLRLTIATLLCTARARPRSHGPRCHNHEEVRQDAIWVVDCNGYGVHEVAPMEQGEFRYEAGGQEWSSRDARMSTVAIDLPLGAACAEQALERVARCVGVPKQFSRCGAAGMVQIVADTSFPSYMETVSSLRDAANICAPTNSTVRVLEPIRAYNEHAVYEARKAREKADIVFMACIGAVVLCWCACSASSTGRYSRLQGR